MTSRHLLQTGVRFGRALLPRGWSPVLSAIATAYPKARMYPCAMNDGDTFYVDLRQPMCHGYFYSGGLPHESYTIGFLRQLLAPGDVFVDVGANVGYFTRLAARLVCDSGQVHAFEPVDAAIRLLERNTLGMNNVHVHRVALSDHAGEAPFAVRRLGDTSSLDVSGKHEEVTNVPLTTIDLVLGEAPRVDVIKIDVEGFEREVIRGGNAVIARHQPVVYFEILPDGSDSGAKLREFAAQLGPSYTLGWINPSFTASTVYTETPSSYVIAAPAAARWRERAPWLYMRP